MKGAFLYREETTKLQFFSLWRIWKHQCVSVRVSEREREGGGVYAVYKKLQAIEIDRQIQFFENLLLRKKLIKRIIKIKSGRKGIY